MRPLIAPAAVALLVALFAALAMPAGAETKVFIIENQPDGYGVDQCLASGANCGKPVASAYCQSRQYGQAVSFRKVDHDEITGRNMGADASCRSRGCSEFIAIECSR
jgi:hypothetical protein